MALSSPRFANNERLQRAAENKPAMRKGEVGEAVRILQQALMDLGFWMDISTKRFGSPDGIFGNETKARVRDFQAQHGLHPDGVVGRMTMDKLDKLLPTAGPALPPLPKNPEFTHRVRIHLRALSLTAIPVSSQEYNAKLVYAQHGIYLDTITSMSLALTPDQEAALEAVDVGECVDEKLTAELGALHALGLQGVSSNDIVIYLAKQVTDETGDEINGCAAINSNRPAVVVSSTATRWTMGHEIGHVLLGNYTPGHSTETGNLMYAPTASITADPPVFDDAQLTAMKASKFCSRF